MSLNQTDKQRRELERLKKLRDNPRIVGEVNPHNHPFQDILGLSTFVENAVGEGSEGSIGDHDHDGTDASKVHYGDLLDTPATFAPSAHAHPTTEITSFAEDVADTVGAMVSSNTETGISVTYDDADNTLDFAVSYGTTAATACVGNDSRLSDARTPTAHTHAAADLTDATATPTASKIPIANGSGDLDAGWIPDLSATYATSSLGVTNGNSHDHSGGDGAQINHTTLSNIGTNTHAQIDTFIGTKAQASGLASLDGSSLVVQNPANATATATASKIPIADGSGKLDTWVSDCASGTKGKIQLTGQLGGSAASPTVTGITETGTSQALTFGTIADGGYVKRSGTALATADLYTDIIFTIDGGGAEIADNATIWRQVNFACTIISWTLMADASGSIVIDIWKDTYANFPPTDADSITASAVPAISTATSATSSTLTGWTTSISAGDVLKINVDSCTTIKTCVLQLKVKL